MACEVVDHKKVESYEEPEGPAAVRHDGADGVGLLLLLGEDVRGIKHDLQSSRVGSMDLDWVPSKLKHFTNNMQHVHLLCFAHFVFHVVTWFQASKFFQETDFVHQSHLMIPRQQLVILIRARAER